MKEIKSFSNLLKDYISILTTRMENKKKNVNIYDAWEEIVKKENLSSSSYLDDCRDNTIFIRVEHPGMAQQIKMKNNKIIKEFKDKFPNLNIKKINIIIDSVFN